MHDTVTERHGKALGAFGRRAPAAPEWIETIDNPYLHGAFAPIVHEVEAVDLPVEGEIPRDLHGAYVRNGPNNRFAPINRYHWFDGDGMVHGIWFENGRARYRNRYVQTPGLAREQAAGQGIWPGVLGPFDFSLPLGPLKDTANTDLLCLDGKLLALWYESGQLMELDPQTLDTIGPFAPSGLERRVSAHSKVDPATGDFVFFSYGDRAPFMRYGVLRPDGTLHQTDITLPGPRRPHDLGVTPRFSVLHDFPVFFEQAHFEKTGKRVPFFHPDVATRFGVIPRFGTDADVRWFSFDPCYMLHVVNCWEEGDTVVMVGCRTADPTLHPDPADGNLAAMLSFLKLQANLYEWRMDLRTGATSERALDDTNAEFPMIHPGVLGTANRYSYLQHIPYESPATFEGLVKADLHRGTTERVAYGEGVFGSESPFVPHVGATEEDDGVLITFVTDMAEGRSACWIYEAQDLAAGPVAKISLPQRVPNGFHATWIDGV